jgi:copper chaperone
MASVKIKGMSCQHCVASTTKALEAIDGITNVRVDLEQGQAHYDGEIDKKVIEEAISKIGFEVIS